MSFGRDDVELVKKETLFKEYFQVDRYWVRHRTFAGGWSPTISREIFERGHVVGVILYDPDRDEIAMVEQFRAGAYAANMGPWLYEIVAGVIDPGQTPLSVAIRESEEEAGAKVDQIFEIGKFIITPGGSSESAVMYCARIDANLISGLHGLADEGEDIRVFTLPRTKAYEMVKSGEINNSMAVIAIQWLMLEHQSVKERWGVK